MPVPTDTYWNIRRLNRVFAISAIFLLATFAWAVLQDYDKHWRQPQRSGKVWEAALVEQKLKLYDTPQKLEQIASLKKQVQDIQSSLGASDQEIQKLNDQLQKQARYDSDLAFRLNTLKAELSVSETNLQNAMTGGDAEEQARLAKVLDGPDGRQKLAAMVLEQTRLKDDMLAVRNAQKERTARRDELQKQLTAANEVRDSLGKKRDALQPRSTLAKVSGMIRAMPLMQFLNPSEKVAQTVVSDVQTDLGGVKRVETLDRCTTCHVNITNKEFTRERIQAYLEEQVASGQKFRYAIPDPARPATLAAATSERPGASAAPEFWHAWGRKLLAPESYAKTNAQVKILFGAVGKVKVTIDGKDLLASDVQYEGNPATQPSVASDGDQKAQRTQDRVLIETIYALLREDPANRALTQARNIATQYPERLRTMLKAELPADQFKELENRYRFAMVSTVNGGRKDAGLAALDPSPVMLAHPRLDLYADADSKHPMESSEGKIGVGCTSCHDGSGVETDFVVAAHVARSIWVDSKTGEPVLPEQLAPKPDARKHTEHFSMASMLRAVYPEGSTLPANVSAMHIQPVAPNEHEAKSKSIEASEKSPPTPYVDPVTGRRGQALPQLHYWMDKYEPQAPRSFQLVYHEWDRPMLPPKYLQANCVRCHTEAYDVRDTAPVVYEGRALFTRMGCVNCHQMDSIPAEQNRKVGPDLRHVTAKLSPTFINAWMWAPKAFRPTSKMPHLFLLENSSSDEEIRRTRQEARAITEYLVRTADPLTPKHLVQPSYKGSAEAGRALFNAVGCMGCHDNLSDPTSDTRAGPDGVKRPVPVAEKWITQDLVKSGKLARDLKAKTGKDPLAKELTTEAVKLYDAMTYNERHMYVMENLEQPSNGVSTGNYPDGTAKPIFIHHGPELSGMGTKLTVGRTEAEARQWLFDWLKDPRHYSDYTVMPRLRLSDQQAMDLSEYLLKQRRTNDKPDDLWNAGEVQPDDAKLRDMVTLFLKSRYNNSTEIAYQKAIDEKEITAYAVDALTTRTVNAKTAAAMARDLTLQQKQMVFLGKKLIGHYGCMSCHAINGTETISSPGANLSDWGQKQVGKLDFGYLEPEKVEGHEVKETVSVQMVNGLSEHAGAMKSDAHAKLIDVGWPELEHTRTSWAQQKLKNTRIWDRGRELLEPDPKAASLELRLGKPYDKLRMPTFYLNDDQVHHLVTFLISNRDRLVSERLTKRAEHDAAVKIARGRELTERYNCVGCHQIENGTMAPPNVAQVQQWYPQDLLVDKAPPSLRGQGNKVQFSWMFNFFKNVEPLRPLLQPAGGIRMPSFHATDAEWTAIIDYFNTISVKESKDLRQQLDPAVKYIATANKADQLKKNPGAPATRPVELKAGVVWYNHPEIPPSEKWPGDDWVDQPTFALTVAALKTWSIQKKQMTEVDFDVTRNSAKDLYRSYRTALYKALFTGDLYDSPYPFVDAARPDSSDPAFAERFDKGRALFFEMQCLSCHHLGDPAATGATKDPKGPNLSLVHERLQRRWARQWMQEPPVIQVSTKMPQFFSGLSALKIDGQTWAVAQNLPPAEIKRTHDTYGATVDEQTNLVLDYLYAVGQRRTTDVQPAKPAPAGSATTKPTAN